MVRPLADHPDWSTKRVKCDTAHRDRDSKWLFDFPLECIEAVFFGACMPVAKKQRIWNACKGTSIQCLQAYVIRDQEDEWGHPGTVRFHKVGDWSEASAWDDLGLVFELGHEEEIEDPPIGIRSLEELPYYEVDKERVELHYRKEKARRNA